MSDTETILRACLRERLAQEYSCRVGMCLACCAEVIQGEVVQPAAYGLTDAERKQFALTCLPRPQSDLRLGRGVYPPSIDVEAGGEGLAVPTFRPDSRRLPCSGSV